MSSLLTVYGDLAVLVFRTMFFSAVFILFMVTSLVSNCSLKVIPTLNINYLWHTALGTLRLVGEGGGGQHTSISFAQEWIATNC